MSALAQDRAHLPASRVHCQPQHGWAAFTLAARLNRRANHRPSADAPVLRSSDPGVQCMRPTCIPNVRDGIGRCVGSKLLIGSSGCDRGCCVRSTPFAANCGVIENAVRDQADTSTLWQSSRPGGPRQGPRPHGSPVPRDTLFNELLAGGCRHCRTRGESRPSWSGSLNREFCRGTVASLRAVPGNSPVPRTLLWLLT